MKNMEDMLCTCEHKRARHNLFGQCLVKHCPCVRYEEIQESPLMRGCLEYPPSVGVQEEVVDKKVKEHIRKEAEIEIWKKYKQVVGLCHVLEFSQAQLEAYIRCMYEGEIGDKLSKSYEKE